MQYPKGPILGLLAWTLVTLGSAHGDGHMDMSSAGLNTHANNTLDPDRNFDLWDEPSYIGLQTHSNLMMAHITCMVIAWFLVLPFGVMFSIVRSKLTLPVQLIFLTLNGLGVACGTIYNANTPDLYMNNVHHKFGWLATFVAITQVVISFLSLYAGRRVAGTETPDERASFLPQDLHSINKPSKIHRWSGDSGHGTEPTSSASTSRTLSPSREYEYRNPETEEPEDMDDVPLENFRQRPSWLENTKIGHVVMTLVSKAMTPNITAFKILYEIIDRTMLIVGFVTLLSGVVTYAGIFRANNVFNGLAHFVKGGIFFWYGLLTLGRWLGSFADLGWAWNLKPNNLDAGWKSRAPSAEFVESFVIFIYGCVDVFMEHMAAWGGEWAAQDLEHISIAIMFFGGGLTGMLVESKTLRRWLNTDVETMSHKVEVFTKETEGFKDGGEEPQTYTISLNIMPALVIFLLGIMMSSHHQDSMVSTMIHQQWGTLLSGFALFRGLTYVLSYLSPPTSIYPSRPPTELAAAFCLIAGGLVFMMSTRDVVHYMEQYGLMAMFTLTVIVGFTAFLMAFAMLAIGLKGWAVRREQKEHTMTF